MSLEFGLTLAGFGILAGWLTVLSEQIRAELQLRRQQARAETQAHEHSLSGPHWEAAQRPVPAASALAAVAPVHKARAYQQVLDTFADDLERDVAQWEAVLCDFPQVLFPEAAELPPPAELPDAPKKLRRKRGSQKPHEKVSPPDRTRIVPADERDLITRLARTGFAPEEIALWLNLPLERVHELLR